MKTSEKGLELIREAEGFVDHVYLDAAGIPTIGYGHRVLNDEAFPKKITKAIGEALLEKDMSWAEEFVTATVDGKLGQGEFDACVSFTYNLGAGTFRKSVGKLIREGRLNEVPAKILLYDHAAGKKLRGLTWRREQEVNLWKGKPIVPRLQWLAEHDKAA